MVGCHKSFQLKLDLHTELVDLSVKFIRKWVFHMLFDFVFVLRSSHLNNAMHGTFDIRQTQYLAFAACETSASIFNPSSDIQSVPGGTVARRYTCTCILVLVYL